MTSLAVNSWESSTADKDAVQFIRKHFSAKECSSFSPREKSDDGRVSKKSCNLRCYCGGLPSDHDESVAAGAASFRRQTSAYSNADGVPDSLSLPLSESNWNQECIVKIPTNAYGRIKFVTAESGYRKPAKYVRLADDSNIQRVFELQMKHWRLGESTTRPDLVISVFGGGKQFQLSDARKREIFTQGIIKAVHTTRGWLFTFGLDFGVGRAVGDAVRDGQRFRWQPNGRLTRFIQAIGIVPWGVVRRNRDLINTDLEALNLVNYAIDSSSADDPPDSSRANAPMKPSFLEPNHTHFLLVDDGFKSSGHGCARFRAKLEQKIASSEADGGLNVPVVCILVEGGTMSVENVCESLKHGLPVLVCEGTGRAADIVALCVHQIDSLNDLGHDDELASRLTEIKSTVYVELKKIQAGWRSSDTDVLHLARLLTNCLKECRHQVYIFNIDKDEDLDVAILFCLLDARKHSIRSQLTLTQKWDRADIAGDRVLKNFVFSSANGFKIAELARFFTEALLRGQVGFIRLFINCGFHMNLYLTVSRLRGLYNSAIRPGNDLWPLLRITRKPMESRRIVLAHVHEMVRRFTRRFTYSKYATDYSDCPNLDTFETPFTELFIWSLLTSRLELAVYFWELCERPLLTAVLGTLLCRSIAKEVDDDTTAKLFGGFKRRMEELAIGLLAEAFDANRENALLMLQRPSNRYDSASALDLAAMAEATTFLATPCCQAAIHGTWMRGIDCASGFEIVLSALFLLPIPFLIDFDEDIVDADSDDENSTSAGEQPPRRPDPADFEDAADGGGSGWGLLRDKMSIAKNNHSPEEQFQMSEVVLQTQAMDYIASAFDGQSVPSADGLRSKRRTIYCGPAAGVVDTTTDNGGEEDEEKAKSVWQHLSLFAKQVKTFYCAPIVMFTVHTIWYVFFLMLYSYVVLFSFRWQLTPFEILLYVWSAALFSEELRVMFAYPGTSLREKLQDWWMFSSFATWNRIDLITMLVSLTAFTLRWFFVSFGVARLLLVLNAIMFYLRVFKVYFVNSYLGPKVVMIKRMLRDMGMFLLVLVVFLCAYTITSQALMFPERTFYVGIFWDLFNHGIWELFGDLQAELTRASGPPSDCFQNSTTYPFDCGIRWWPVPLLLAAYLFIGNILLVNMLIAIFAHVFDDVQSNAQEIWKYEMYFLVEEYRKKPMLPAPFIFFVYFWRLKTNMWRCAKAGKRKQLKDDEFSLRDRELLTAFERVSRSDFVHNKRRLEEKRSDVIIQAMSQQITKLQRAVSDLDSRMQSLDQARAWPQSAENSRKGLAFEPMLKRFQSTTGTKPAAKVLD